MKNCKLCGQINNTDSDFHSKSCKKLYNEMINKGDKNLEFYSYSAAGRYFNRDFRTIKKYENILYKISKRSDLNPKCKFVECKICKNKSKSSNVRSGYCKKCSKKGLSRKEQGKKISKLYQGINNPNYKHGNSGYNFRNTPEWKRLVNKLTKKINNCKGCGSSKNLHCHHIIPAWFCKYQKIDLFCENNITIVCEKCHKVIHHYYLDLELLPNLYSLYKKDAQQLLPKFDLELQSDKFHQLLLTLPQELDLLECFDYSCYKKLSEIHPEFYQSTIQVHLP